MKEMAWNGELLRILKSVVKPTSFLGLRLASLRDAA